jgi:hypothetical protein
MVKTDRQLKAARLMVGESGFKGVTRQAGAQTRPWRVRIWIDGRCRSLGSFESPEDAARYYEEAARTRRIVARIKEGNSRAAARRAAIKDEVLRLSLEGLKTPAVSRAVSLHEIKVMRMKTELRAEGRL